MADHLIPEGQGRNSDGELKVSCGLWKASKCWGKAWYPTAPAPSCPPPVPLPAWPCALANFSQVTPSTSGGASGGSLGLPAWLPVLGRAAPPLILLLQAPGGSVTSLHALTPLVLACRGGAQRVKGMDHEGEGRKWGFYDFPKGK